MKKLISALLCTALLISAPTALADKAPKHDEPSTGSIPFQLVGTDGNHKTYDLDKVPAVENSPLEGKTIYWLGSSVTAGTGSKGQAIAHLFEKTDGVQFAMEAVAGTTLMTLEGEEQRSYVSRLVNTEKLDRSASIDAFFCQVSTNDATFERIDKLGEITPADVTDLSAFDLSTTAGAVEYVIAYAHDTWGCPVYFYAGSYFGDPGDEGIRTHEDPIGSNYARVIDIVKQAAEKWDAMDGYRVAVLDLFNDEAFNSLVSDTDYAFIMKDAVHPHKAGYLYWWLPEFQSFLYTELDG